jgi:hypothetical protein
MSLHIVVGLPGIGKSTYAHARFAHVFDDCLSNPWYADEVLKRLSRGEEVCIVDPRFVIPSVFERHISRFAYPITVHLFKNDPELAIARSCNRALPRDTPALEKTIREYSAQYDPEVYKRFHVVLN